MKYGECFIDLASIWKKLGTCVLIALLVLHALTGCDTAGKFSGRGEGTWVKRFLLAIEDERFPFRDVRVRKINNRRIFDDVCKFCL